MSPITLFTTTYLLIGMSVGWIFITKHRDKINLALDMDDVPDSEKTSVLIAGFVLFIFGWPVILSQLKDE